jgi:hypothetical protein
MLSASPGVTLLMFTTGDNMLSKPRSHKSPNPSPDPQGSGSVIHNELADKMRGGPWRVTGDRVQVWCKAIQPKGSPSWAQGLEELKRVGMLKVQLTIYYHHMMIVCSVLSTHSAQPARQGLRLSWLTSVTILKISPLLGAVVGKGVALAEAAGAAPAGPDEPFRRSQSPHLILTAASKLSSWLRPLLLPAEKTFCAFCAAVTPLWQHPQSCRPELCFIISYSLIAALGPLKLLLSAVCRMAVLCTWQHRLP